MHEITDETDFNDFETTRHQRRRQMRQEKKGQNKGEKNMSHTRRDSRHQRDRENKHQRSPTAENRRLGFANGTASERGRKVAPTRAKGSTVPPPVPSAQPLLPPSNTATVLQKNQEQDKGKSKNIV